MPLPSTTLPLLERLERTTALPDRLSLLGAIGRDLTPDHPSEALEYLTQGIELATELKRSYDRARFQMWIGTCRRRLKDYSGACSAFRNAGLLFRTTGEEQDEAAASLEFAGAALDAGRYEESAEAYRRSLDIRERLGDTEGMPAALKGLGDLHDRLDDFGPALEFYRKGLGIARDLGDARRIGIGLSDVGILHAKLGQYDRARASLEESLTQFRLCGASELEVLALTNLSGVQAESGDTGAAVDSGLRGLALYEALDDRRGLATLLLNLSNLYERDGHPETALNMRMKGYDLFVELGDRHGEATALFGLGNLYRKTGRNDRAAQLLDHALSLALETGNSELEYRCREALSVSFEEIGNLRGALDHTRACLRLRAEREVERRRRETGVMQARFDMERAEKEREILRLRNEQLELENRHKATELAALSMQLAEQSRLMSDVSSEIEKIEDGESERSDRVREIVRTIRRNTSTKEDWKRFEEQFDRMHSNFVRRLTGRFPSITVTESRVCALVRLGLSSAEIADLLHVTKRSVDTHRYRLRKKLNLGERANLFSFLTGMEGVNEG